MNNIKKCKQENKFQTNENQKQTVRNKNEKKKKNIK